MINLSNFLKEQKRNELLTIANKPFTTFEESVDTILDTTMTELSRLEERRTQAIVDERNYHRDIDNTPELKGEAIDILLNIENDIELITENLTATIEMKIIYLFKSLEIRIKLLIKAAYPDIETKPFYKWQNIQSFFKSKNISVSNLPGYKEVTDLKRVNDCLKHNDIPNQDIKSICEFKNENVFHFSSLESFNNRIKQSIPIFSVALSELVINDLFQYNSERIKKLAGYYKRRMDSTNISEFIFNLQN